MAQWVKDPVSPLLWCGSIPSIDLLNAMGARKRGRKERWEGGREMDKQRYRQTDRRQIQGSGLVTSPGQTFLCLTSNDLLEA